MRSTSSAPWSWPSSSWRGYAARIRPSERLARRGLDVAERCGHRSSQAEIRRWLQRAGRPVEPDGDEPGPWAPALAGDWRAAAAAWRRLGDRYESALELAGSGDPAATNEGLTALEELGATATTARLRAAR